MKELPTPRIKNLDNFDIEILTMDCIHDPNNFVSQGLQLNSITQWWRVKGTKTWLNAKLPKLDATLNDIIDFLTEELTNTNNYAYELQEKLSKIGSTPNPK